ncbi:hypothetical protein J4437_06740 [Candidatus Woesearchaeota archaeon]|nr:hypothetical protein [Candidatus Woesearchaeota archaeon]
MKTESHLRSIKESLEVINECLERGLETRQRTIGFSVSAASADMLETLLHQLNLIDSGFVLKHEWLKSKNKVTEKLPFDFPKKNEILVLMAEIEQKRNILCYGTPQKIETIKEILEKFNRLRKLFREVGLNEA